MSSCAWWRCEAFSLELDLRILVYMVKEEWRLHKSFQGAIGSHVFPLVIFLFSVFLSLSTPLILRNIEVSRVLLILHLAFLSYGLFVGALAYIGEQVMTRRLGQVNMLLTLPKLYPITFRRVMAIFYFKDAFYYLIYSIIPLIGGIAVSAPFAGVSYLGVARLFITLFLAFMIGMGLSFFVSAVAIRSRYIACAIGFLILCLVSTVWPYGILTPGVLFPPLGYWKEFDLLYLASSTVLASLLSLAALLLVKERYESCQLGHRDMFLSAQRILSFIGDLSTLVAKEWVELWRGGALGPVVTGYLGPLLAIYMLVWILGSGLGIPVSFNVVFYGSFVGFLGITVYSWITNLESNEFLNSQPVAVHQVIRAKLVIYLVITFVVSICYVCVIGQIQGQLGLLPQALLASGANTVYIAAVTSRITGLWTNTMLFDAKVLLKFTGAAVPPLVALIIASLMMDINPTLATILSFVFSLIILLSSIPIFKSLKGRWEKTSFSFTIQTS